MTARMHSQRTVRRGFNKPRYTRQKPITRGGNPGVVDPVPVVATGANAGVPGTWIPSGATPAASVVAMAGLTAVPSTPWVNFQFVQTLTPGAAGRTCWSGTDWVGGVAPGGLDVDGSTIAEIQAYVDAHDDIADEVLAYERVRTTPRITLIDWLEGFIAHRDEP